MNEEFHYYVIAMLARRAGFAGAEADTLAYASQYVDHALVAYQVRGNGVEYETAVTHHFGFWDRGQEDRVWLPFHFMPGDPQRAAERRFDRAYNPLAVTANGPRARTLLISALKSRDLMRIGIALHTFADTYAHENFTGRNESFNRFDPNSPLPPIGHAHAGRSPDRLDTVWEDPRLVPEHRRVSNRERFFAAAKKTYRYLATYQQRDFSDEELVLGELEMIVGPPGAERPAEERILDFIIREDIAQYRRNEWKGEAVELDEATGDEEITGAMDKYLWLKDEITRRTGVGRRPVRAKTGFYRSKYYRWHEAAKAHRTEALRLLDDLGVSARL